MGNWHRREPDPKARVLPGRFVVTPAFRDLIVIGVGDHGIATVETAIARAMAWHGVAPLANARETRELNSGRTRVELRSDIAAPEIVQEIWRAFIEGRRVGEEMICRTPSRGSLGSEVDPSRPGRDSTERADRPARSADRVREDSMSQDPSTSRAFSGSNDRIPDGEPIRGAGVAEIFVRFRDWQIYYQPCKTGMVATARIASWLSRYPLAKVRETSKQMLIILIEIDEICPDEFKTQERV